VSRSAGGGAFGLDSGESVLEPVAGSVDRDDFAVVQEPVEDGGGQDLVAEDLTPFIWGWLMFVVRDRCCWLGTCGLPRFPDL
jgi:hypothetical protein